MKWFQPASLVVEVSQIVFHEADETNVVVGLFDADPLASEDLAEIDLAAIEADSTTEVASAGLERLSIPFHVPTNFDEKRLQIVLKGDASALRFRAETVLRALAI